MMNRPKEVWEKFVIAENESGKRWKEQREKKVSRKHSKRERGMEKSERGENESGKKSRKPENIFERKWKDES